MKTSSAVSYARRGMRTSRASSRALIGGDGAGQDPLVVARKEAALGFGDDFGRRVG
jgi:hypothetical protein